MLRGGGAGADGSAVTAVVGVRRRSGVFNVLVHDVLA